MNLLKSVIFFIMEYNKLKIDSYWKKASLGVPYYFINDSKVYLTIVLCICVYYKYDKAWIVDVNMLAKRSLGPFSYFHSELHKTTLIC